MFLINDAIVEGGKIVLSNLPFADGQRVRVTVSESETSSGMRRSIEEVRKLLKGSVEKFEDPFEPMIPEDDWD